MPSRRLPPLPEPSAARRALKPLLAILLVLATVWGVQLWRLHRSVDASAAYWSQPRGEPGGLLYVALGDSAAQGIGASSPERGYVGLLAERLRASTGRPVQVVNLSRSGARTADVVRDQLPRLADLSPDLVTVAVGGNDVLGYDRADYAADAAALVAGLPPGAVVGDVPYFMHGRFERNATAASHLLSTEAAAAGLPVAPLHDTMRERGWRAMITDYAADWFHPDDGGHRVWADAFWSALPDELTDPTG